MFNALNRLRTKREPPFIRVMPSSVTNKSMNDVQPQFQPLVPFFSSAFILNDARWIRHEPLYLCLSWFGRNWTAYNSSALFECSHLMEFFRDRSPQVMDVLSDFTLLSFCVFIYSAWWCACVFCVHLRMYNWKPMMQNLNLWVCSNQATVRMHIQLQKKITP